MGRDAGQIKTWLMPARRRLCWELDQQLCYPGAEHAVKEEFIGCRTSAAATLES